MRKKITEAQRSYMMSCVKGRDTKPELAIRSLLHRNGYRFRVCTSNLPGRPDIVLKKHMAAIFVHGCFWHQHGRCKNKRVPKSNKKYWKNKFIENRLRDRRKRRALIKNGRKVLTIWECQIKKLEKVQVLLDGFLKSKAV